MIIDLRKGFGDFEKYSLTKFPDNSIKFIVKERDFFNIIISMKSNEDFMVLAAIKDVANRLKVKTKLNIHYLMYQQDDRVFSNNENFGLKVVSNLLNFLNFDFINIFHPHSDKVELINNCRIIPNTLFLENVLKKLSKNDVWVIPDSGAFKTQYKQITELKHENFISCSKSRNNSTGTIETIVNSGRLEGKNCFIVDDICLGGRTFIQIAEKLQELGCEKLYLIVSHGIFNKNLEGLELYFDKIYTTDSICNLKESSLLEIYNL